MPAIGVFVIPIEFIRMAHLVRQLLPRSFCFRFVSLAEWNGSSWFCIVIIMTMSGHRIVCFFIEWFIDRLKMSFPFTLPASPRKCSRVFLWKVLAFSLAYLEFCRHVWIIYARLTAIYLSSLNISKIPIKFSNHAALLKNPIGFYVAKENSKVKEPRNFSWNSQNLVQFLLQYDSNSELSAGLPCPLN